MWCFTGQHLCVGCVVAVFLWRDREVRAAKIIFHVSGGQPWLRLVAIARSGGFDRCRTGRFLSLGSIQPFSRQMDPWFGVDRERNGADGRIFYPGCGDHVGAVLPGDCRFLVSRAYFGLARRPAAGGWNDRHGDRACLTWAGGFFARWPLVRTPRNCDSAFIAPTRIVNCHGSSGLC